MNATTVSGEKIDPRIRARRVEVLREQGRRRLRMLLTSVVVLCTVGFVWLVVESPLLETRHVDVAGATRVTPAEVRAAARIPHGSALVTLDGGAIARRVEKLAWVSRASVTKHLPGTVRIAVTERTATSWARVPAVNPGGATVALVDATGRVLADVGTPPAGLPELVGVGPVPGPGGDVRRTLLDVRSGLAPDLAPYVAAITATPDGVSLRLVPGLATGEIRLGPPEDLTAKNDAALAVLRGLGATRVRYIDVSVPQAPATG